MFHARFRTAILVASVLALLLPAAASADRSFTTRFSANDTGDITFVANTLMTCPESHALLAGARRHGDADHQPAEQRLRDDLRRRRLRLVDVRLLDLGHEPAGREHGALRRPLLGRRLQRQRLERRSELVQPQQGRVQGARRQRLPQRHRVRPRRLERRAAGATRRSPTSPRSSRRPATAPTRSATSRPARAPTTTPAGRSSIAYRDTTQPARNLTVFDGLDTINGIGRRDDPGQRLQDAARRPGPDHARLHHLRGRPRDRGRQREPERHAAHRRAQSADQLLQLDDLQQGHRGSRPRTPTIRTSSGSTPISSTRTASSPTTRPRRTSR